MGTKTRRALLVSLVVVLCGVSGGWGGKRAAVDGGKLTFDLHDLEGKAVSSKDERFKGKVVLVDVFGTWCPPCIRAISTFSELHTKYGDDGLVILGIAILRGLKELPPELRAQVGEAANRTHRAVEAALADKRSSLDADRTAPAHDPTLPGVKPARGGIHIITRTEQHILDIFRGMGFAVARGPHRNHQRL